MKGPIQCIRSGELTDFEDIGALFEWEEGKAYLLIDQVAFRGRKGAVLCYYNPPVHQVGNPALDAYLEGLDRVFEKKEDLGFLIFYGANDPVHAGGDLKESLDRLDMTLQAKKEREAEGAAPEEIDRLYSWADDRLLKGVTLHKKIRQLASYLRVVSLCGGGTRFGGSAEIPLMADVLVGDSRSGMCFSEAMIGLIPGWSGVARALIKAGPDNTAFMAMTGSEVKAPDLLSVGIYNAVVDIPFPFPRRERSEDPDADKRQYLEALLAHDDETGRLLMPKGLELATCPAAEIPGLDGSSRKALASMDEITAQVEKRKNPQTYSRLWGKPLREVRDEVGKLGRPLASQSIEALNALLELYDPSGFDEQHFVQREMEADARLYRDPRFREGLIATLEQRVADYREVK